MAQRITHPTLPIITIFTLLLCLSGCASRTTPPAAKPAHVPGFLGLQEEFGNLDFSPLRNRSIVLDPGHGGFFKGAQGPEGLTEAEVNLGVALYLRGLLEWAGAQVHLTRTADYDFLTLADSTLASDLAFRSSFTDSLQPDVFISIHHNSTASKDPDINETQTYYPLGDDGASLDLARSIHRHLVLNLEISPAKILPGNFHVLRKATVPAVLGEPAMISNPVMEGRLSLASSHELEAKAYFLGLLDYFSSGQPRWSVVDTLRMDAGMPTITLTKSFLTSAVGQPEGPAPDPSSFHLTLDGVTQGFDLSADGHSITWRPTQPLPNSSSSLRVTGRNLKGRATPVSETVILISAGPRLKVIHSTESPDENLNPRTMLYWNTRTNTNGEEGLLSVNDEFNLHLPPQHQGWFLLPQDAGQEAQFEFRSKKTGLISPVSSSKGPNLPPGYRWRLLTIAQDPVFASSIMPPQGWHHRLRPATIGYGNPMVAAGSPAVVWNPETAIWIEAKGVLPLVHPGSGRNDRIGTLAAEQEIWRPQLLLHQLFGKTIVLDPAGGGTNTGGTYALGSRASDLNLETARQVKLLLEGAGATVLMTRQGEVASDPQQKVILAGEKKADLFLTIARTLNGSPITALHHPGSVVGEHWAKAMIQALAPMDSLTLDTSYAYLLRHTACPALEIRLRAPLDAKEEMRMTEIPWHMAEARAILLSCAAALSPEKDLPQTVDPVALLNQLSAEAADRSLQSVQWARWDGNFNWVRPSFQESTDTVASWDTTGWPAVSDLHTLEIHSGSQWQLWRVQLTGSVPLFQLIMENR